ncbi:DUF494 domain-containing protein [Chitinilyticum piscinae]|uniref:Protein Smg homolog n=1 Tax=Chitinilyticum piscinae TaxID=2866724 RepID=A0A8J7FJP3_9NEIS|nr:DUF494 domain-containing protein [Chitinilyticum piscinae]MBE9610615.1 DUF494 domain-containing protein [Chitinilyticum piscinae]
MLEVLAYLFEELYGTEYPDTAQLARKLDVAGFADEDIREALQWMEESKSLGCDQLWSESARSAGVRVLHPQELERMSVEAVSLLYALIQSGVLDAIEREQLLERVMREPDGEVSLERMQLLVLMLVWRKQDQLSNLWVEEILFGREDATLH